MSAIPNLPEETAAVGSAIAIANGTASKSVPFKLNDLPIENFRPIKIIAIGAGYSGVYCGIRIPEKIRNAELVIYEKNDGIGGTWWENRYPGCACDVPSHSYQFSFEPNRNWSSLYAPAREIQAYLEGTAKKYGADRFMKLSHEITECRWDEQTAKWRVSVKDLSTGNTFKDTSDVLISARGNLNTIKWPAIPGLDKFQGEVMHSAKWNEKYDFTNKRIAVIGSGSSAIQIVPNLQKLPGTQLSTFVRSQTWISPPFGQQLWDEYGFEGYSIPPALQQKFHDEPEHYHKFRLMVEEDGNGIHGVTIRGTPIQQGAKQLFKDHMATRLASHPHIFNALLPDFSPGCRRLTPGPGYLEALTKPNVAFITSPITSISESAVHTDDGKAHEIDALICATGFHTSTAPPFSVYGAQGLSLHDKWSERPSTYLSHSISSFPNLWTMLGPNAAIGSGSLTMMIESVGDYVLKCIRKLQKDNIACMSVKQEREDDFTEYVDEYFEGTVFSEECRSWYRGGKTKAEGGKVTGLWPGSTLHCIEAMRSPRWEDYDYRYVGEDPEGGFVQNGDEAEYVQTDATGSKKRSRTTTSSSPTKRKRVNRMAWLGNGWSANQLLEPKHLAWYLYPEFQDPPVPGRPEEKESLKIRPFSY